jgi:penicillin-binding protein 1A
VENASGRVLALVGGYETRIEGFVRATQARRQPGSSFKAYVYAAALLGGHTQLSKVLDGPLSLPAGGGRYWTPSNYSGAYAGWLPLRTALAKSLNTVSVRLTLERGAGEVARLAQAMGVKTPLRRDPTLALGSSEVTPMDQAMGYSTIARLGVPMEPVFIDRVDDALGREVGRAGGPIFVDEQVLGRLPGAPGARALPAGVAYELADMLREVVHSGTGKRAFRKGLDRAGKTGTSNGFLDAWFVGFTPRFTIAVWIGTDGNTGIGEDETGGRVALPVWLEILSALPEAEAERLTVPDDALLVQAFGTWIGLPSGHVPAEVLKTAPLDAAPLPYPARSPVRAASPRTPPPSDDEWLYGLPD